MKKPNIFSIATSELSQDAMISWLLAWADKSCLLADSRMHRVGLEFLRRLLQTKGVSLPEEGVTVRVHRQYLNVDIVVEVNESYVLLIEDKVHALEHGDQLERYLNTINQEFPNRIVVPVYIKTGDQFTYDSVTALGYTCLGRRDLIALIRHARLEFKADHPLLIDFLDHLESMEDRVQQFNTACVNDWTGSTDAWVGFYKFLNQRIGVAWGNVNNASGGFVAAWWANEQVDDNKTIYLQIEQGPLCFKIAVTEADPERRRIMRDHWHRRIMESAQAVGISGLERPNRFGNGSTMTVALAPANIWLQRTSEGFLDPTETLEVLGQMQRVIKEAVEHSSKQGPGSLPVI